MSLISQQIPGISTNYFGYDGHGSTRFLIGLNGSITDTYVYDAFGNLISRTGSGTPNNYLYCGQQFDPDLGLYYNRARYLSTDLGRFWTSDQTDGNNEDPLSLHKYLYCQASPIDLDDPTGYYSSWEQFLGYEAQDAIIENYEDTHPWINRNEIVSDMRVPVKSRKYTYLKPDILNLQTKQWLEVKPLSPFGIARGVVKYALDYKLLKPLGYFPDVS